jgi:hypothetical protein
METPLQNKEKKTMFKIFLPWQDEDEEKWLEEMSGSGWQLESTSPYLYSFTQAYPERVIYRLDYKQTLDKDYQEYLNIFKDAGWELAALMSNWHYFRIQPQNQVVPEIYNSDRAKAQKYRRLLFGLMPFFILFIVLFPRTVHFESLRIGTALEIIYTFAMILMGFIFFLWIFVLIKLLLKIRRLESHTRE